MSLTITVEPHPLLDVGVFVTRITRPLVEIAVPTAITDLAQPGANAPFSSSDAIKTAVRDLLRHGGFKPAGRSKPASEYLTGAVAEGRFPSINALVDACNVVSLHSGLPISLVDIDRLEVGPLAIRIAPAGTTYVFNPSGQVIDASGLVCLYDAAGPTGTPVKDAQRTKTHDDTHAAVAIVWGTNALPGRTAAVTRWYRDLVERIPSATVEDVTLA
ncbi:MAG TPA: phenylalanine--tRNA ligase beta subunit-related protein [Kofleriaceae bacterium]|nr:phenylalanine--tRNA ligase beta subunit-related protein [Kofleriaceae bacterium]